MLNRTLLVFLALGFVCSTSLVAEGQSRSSFSAVVKGLVGVSSLIPDSGETRSTKKVSPVKLSLTAYVPGFGRLRLRYNERHHLGFTPTFTDENGVVTYDHNGTTLLRGRVRSKSEQSPVAGSIYSVDGVPYLFASFVAQKRNKPKDAHIRLEIPLKRLGRSKIRARVRTTRRLNKPGTCAAERASGNHLRSTHHDNLPQLAALTVPNIYLRLDGDFQLFQKLGFNANNVMVSIFNEAATLYQQQLGFQLNLAWVNTYNQFFFGNSDPAVKLDTYIDFTKQQQYFQQKQAHSYHLITGESMADGNVLGRAYIAEICVGNDRQMGVNTYTGDGRTPYTFAHELGHNLGADHDNSKPETIMFPDILTPPQKSFSNFTIGVIFNHVAQFGPGCLFQFGEPFPNPGSGTPTPTPTPPPGGGPPTGGGPINPQALSISLSSKLTKKGKFSAGVNLSQARGDCSITIKGSAKRKKVATGNTLATLSGLQISQSLSATVSHRARGGKKKTAKAYLQAAVSCSTGESALSNVVAVKASKVRGGKYGKSLKIGAWLKRLKKSLGG